MRLQSSLGRISQNYRPDMNMSGYLTVAKVIKVHHKSGTADVVAVNSKDTFTSNGDNEGKFSARILQNFSNYDESRGKYWGSVSPIAEGSLVLLGFLDNMKNRPVILGQFHRPDNVENVLPGVYPLNEKEGGYNRREALKTLNVYPSLAYKKIDGESNIEFSHASKSFFAMYNTSMDTQDYLNDSHMGFDHQNLTEVDSRTGQPIETDIDEAKSPTKMLFVHRSSFDNDSTTWTKFFVDASGLSRITRDNNDGKLTFLELSEKGRFSVRRQLDSPLHNESDNYSEIAQEEDGHTVIRRVNGDTVTEIGVNQAGNAVMSHSSGSVIEMGEDITIETDGEIISDSFSRFIEKNHIAVSHVEPENPNPYLLWVDLSDDN
jgi:hypothetical protein